MIVHAINDLSNSVLIDFLKSGLYENARGMVNYDPSFENNSANLFYVLAEGRYTTGNYYIIEEDGKYVASAGWNIFQETIVLTLSRAYITPKYRSQYLMAHLLIPRIFNEAKNFNTFWITCNDYNKSIYNGLYRTYIGKSTGWPDIYKKFVPIGTKVVNNTLQHVAEYQKPHDNT